MVDHTKENLTFFILQTKRLRFRVAKSPINYSYFRLSAPRRQRCPFLRSSRVWVPPTLAASTMLPKFDPKEIRVVCTGGEVGATCVLAPRSAPGPVSKKGWWQHRQSNR